MIMENQNLGAVIFDWAGTVIDFGSRAPIVAICEIFRRKGVELSESVARGPMGMNKRDHLLELIRLPDVAARWKSKYGRDPQESDVDDMYRDFLPLQHEVLAQHCDLIPGALDAINECRKRGMKIGSTTGYTSELMELVMAAAAKQGYSPDAMVCGIHVPAGRPAPWMLFETAKRLGVYPMWRIVNVDDTPAGLRAGVNAGTWNVGISLSGNEVGLSEKELAQLPQSKRDELRRTAEEELTAAGAHFVIASVAELPKVISEITVRLAHGEHPTSSVMAK